MVESNRVDQVYIDNYLGSKQCYVNLVTCQALGD